MRALGQVDRRAQFPTRGRTNPLREHENLILTQPASDHGLRLHTSELLRVDRALRIDDETAAVTGRTSLTAVRDQLGARLLNRHSDNVDGQTAALRSREGRHTREQSEAQDTRHEPDY